MKKIDAANVKTAAAADAIMKEVIPVGSRVHVVS
jgi:hypothetical protein